MQIPKFTRTVLPDTSVGSVAIDVARQQGDINAAQLQDARHQIVGITSQLNEYAARDIAANNATWVNQATIQFKKDMADATDQLREARAGNPEGFAQQFDADMLKKQEDFLKAAPTADAQRAARDTIARMREAQYEENLGWSRQRKVELYAGSLETSQDNLTGLAVRAAQHGQPIDDLLNNADASALAGATIVSGPEKVDKIRHTMREGIINAYMTALTEQNPYAAKKLLDSGKYDKELGGSGINTFQNHIDDEIKKRENEAKAKLRIGLADDVANVEQSGRLGIEVPKETISSIISRSEAAGLPEVAKKMRSFEELQTETIKFAKQPLEVQVKALAASKSEVEAGNLASVDKYAAESEILKTKVAAIKTDPWSYYGQRNVVRTPQPLDFASPEKASYEIDQRRLSAHTVKELDGVNLPLLTPSEIDRMKEVYDTGTPQAASRMINQFSNLKPDEMDAIANTISKTSPVLGVAIAVGDPVVSQRIIEGSKIKSAVTPADVRRQVDKTLAGVIDDPVLNEGIQASIFSYYKSLQFQQGSDKDTVDGDLVDKSITDILGPIATIHGNSWWGGSNVLSYKDQGVYVPSEILNNKLSGITDEQIKAQGQNPVGSLGIKFTAKDLLKSGRFVSSGDGKYGVVDTAGNRVMNQDGSVFIINARKLK